MKKESGRLRLSHGEMLTRVSMGAVGNIKGSEVPKYFLEIDSLRLSLPKLCLVSIMCPMAIHHVWSE